MHDTDDWPLCVYPRCDEEVNPKRVAILTREGKPAVCLKCGDRAAKSGPPVRIIEVPKSNPMVVRPDADIRGIASSHKGNRQAF